MTGNRAQTHTHSKFTNEAGHPTHASAVADAILNKNVNRTSGFVHTLESPGIKMLRLPGLKSPGKGIGPGKVLEF